MIISIVVVMCTFMYVILGFGDIKKIFYKEDPAVSGMSEDEVFQFR